MGLTTKYATIGANVTAPITGMLRAPVANLIAANGIYAPILLNDNFQALQDKLNEVITDISVCVAAINSGSQ